MTTAQIHELRDAGILTHRQAHVLELRYRGFSQNQIALALGISRTTVRYLERTARHNITRRKDAA